MLHCLTAARYAWSAAKTSRISGSISAFQTSALGWGQGQGQGPGQGQGLQGRGYG